MHLDGCCHLPALRGGKVRMGDSMMRGLLVDWGVHMYGTHTRDEIRVVVKGLRALRVHELYFKSLLVAPCPLRVT